jgi:hypothetical protein
LNVKCVFWFSLRLSETLIILTRTGRDKNVYCLHIKYPLFLTYFNKNWIFSTVSKIFRYQISWKSDQCGPNFSMRGQMDRQTWRN